jgi:hypothetical protein
MNPILFLPIFGGLIVYYVIKVLIRLPGKNLHARFIKVGPFVGLSQDDFIKKVGPFQSVANYQDGSRLCIWQAAGYMMGIIFTSDGLFARIHQEIIS